MIDKDDFSTASSNEMTGLAPSVAHNEYEAENYADLCAQPIHIPRSSKHPLSDKSVCENIHAEYRKEVVPQTKKQNS